MSIRLRLLMVRAAASLFLMLWMMLGHTALGFSQQQTSSLAKQRRIRMDTEGGLVVDSNTKYLLKESKILSTFPSTTKKKIRTIPPLHCPIQQAESAVGMPWTSSIDASYNQDEKLTYMPFWTWQLDYMKQHLTNLTCIPATNLNGTLDVTLCQNIERNARIVNLAFECNEYRKIRMTYYDAGRKTQVFNSLWYPRANLPVLGIDLLQFHQTRHLAVVDFQPLYQDEHKHDAMFQHLLQPIRQEYDSLLRGKMSKRFYDETQFFSPEMLFARFDDASIISRDLMPAYQQYVSTHVDLVKSVVPTTKIPWSRWASYDAYSAERDPAKGMFEKMFGNEWADAYVHEFLFDQSRVDRMLDH